MPKRSVSDEEISLIKAMLGRGLKNRDIQFYFNRPDRPVNTGRITQIRKGTYGPNVNAATDAALQKYLDGRKAGEGSAVAKRSVGERARDHFTKRGSDWYLKTHETDEAECKATFHGVKPADRSAAAIRGICGLANNKGGFLFFGVQEQADKSLKVTGMSGGNSFAGLDPADLNAILVSTLDPVPVFQLGLLDIDGKQVGFIEVAKHDAPPILATKNLGTDVKEGGIYFRYVGETRLIRAGELRQLIMQRERKAVEQFAKSMQRVADGVSATLDLDTGQVGGATAQFVLDEASLKKVQFLREGDFKQKDGAPALKLIGDVRIATPDGARIVRHNITPDDVIRNFLQGELVAEPLQYILSLAHAGRTWLPIWYYVQLSGLETKDVISALNAERPTQPSHRASAIARLAGKKSAYKIHQGTPKKILADILEGKLAEPKSQDEDSNFALAVQGIPDGFASVDTLKAALTKSLARAQGTDPKTNGRRSNIFRAACRLDEVIYRRLLAVDK